jgi:hypothetical protein
VGVHFMTGVSAGGEMAGGQLAARLADLPSYQRASLEARLVRTDLLQPLYEAQALTGKEAAVLLEQIRERHNFGGKQEMMQRTPSSLYRPSLRPMPETLPPVAYAAEAEVRLVSEKGIFTFQRRLIHVGRAFAGLEVELKPTPMAGHYVVIFAGQVLGQVDVSAAEIDETTSLSLQAI